MRTCRTGNAPPERSSERSFAAAEEVTDRQGEQEDALD